MDSDVVSRFRAAVSSGEFAKATALWSVYSREIEGEIRRGVCGESRMREARELLEWARRVVLCARASALLRLNATARGQRAAEAYGRIAQA